MSLETSAWHSGMASTPSASARGSHILPLSFQIQGPSWPTEDESHARLRAFFPAMLQHWRPFVSHPWHKNSCDSGDLFVDPLLWPGFTLPVEVSSTDSRSFPDSRHFNNPILQPLAAKNTLKVCCLATSTDCNTTVSFFIPHLRVLQMVHPFCNRRFRTCLLPFRSASASLSPS